MEPNQSQIPPVNASSNVIVVPIAAPNEEKKDIGELPTQTKKDKDPQVEPPVEEENDLAEPPLEENKAQEIIENAEENNAPPQERLGIRDLEDELLQTKEEKLLEGSQSKLHLTGASPKKVAFSDAGGASPKSPVGIKRSPHKKQVDERTG